MPMFPEDIFIEILSLLSARSISRFRCVCKRWYALFKNPKFVKMQFHHAIKTNKFSVVLEPYADSRYVDGLYYSIDFDVTSSSYHMIANTNLPTYQSGCLDGSCDGLIVLYSDRKIRLWNPSTREYKSISTPSNPTKSKKINHFSQYGVYYDWKIDEYKLFEIMSHGNDRYDHTSRSEVWVCRLGSESWESIGNIPYGINECSNISKKPLKGGIIHWIKKTKVIVSFDIVEVRTKEIHIPDSCYLDDELNWLDMEVGVLGEDLYLSVNDNENNNIDLWVMKDYGVIDSWTKIFSISKEETKLFSLVPLHYINKNREILLWGDGRLEGEDSATDILLSYDLKYGRLSTLDIPCMPKYFSATTCVQNLISLNSGKFPKAEKRSMLGIKRKRGANL